MNSQALQKFAVLGEKEKQAGGIKTRAAKSSTDSVWETTVNRLHFEALKGNKSTDVLIIGGGIAGILCAFKLKNAGVDCLLAEAAEICSGITKNTTAKITLGHGLIYDKMIKRFGEDTARLYAQAQDNAIKEYARLCKDNDCGYQTQDNYVYSLNDRKKIENEVAALTRIAVKAEFSDACELPFSVAGAVRVKDQAQFHPLKFLYAVAKDLPIYEHTKVWELLPHKAKTNHGEITYKKLIIATHFPINNKHGLYSLKLYQHRSYVIALKGAQHINGMYVDESDTGMSFRSYGNLLLLGGGGHRTGKKGGCWQELEAFAKKHCKNAEVVGKWATQDCMTLDDIPYIGQYSKSTPNFFVATGFNKWGITNALVSANILCDLVQERCSPYADVFDPSRTILRSQLAVNVFESVIGTLTPTVPRCPHLGCALTYNRVEHSWDCPCHGSRFTEHGALIDNPAMDDKKI
ncbi:MAG: FAD-dependent oxidoreductase [Clostridia bacterium]|nr:FAD-dependent oxidoreductase [Clostridia bacterium]